MRGTALRLEAAPLFALALAAALTLVAACSSPTSTEADEGRGSLSIAASVPGLGASISASVRGLVKTAFPGAVDLSTLSYSLSLTNPDASPSTIDGGTDLDGVFATISAIPAGIWTATVVASVDDGGTLVPIGSGSRALIVTHGATTSATVDLVPPTVGSGTITASCDWSSFAAPASSTPLFLVTPVFPTGTTVAPGITITSASSFAYSGAWPSGIYRVEARLSAGTAQQWGATEIVYVLDGYTTTIPAYAVPAGAEKLAPPIPSVTVATGYDIGSSSIYAFIAWGATSTGTTYMIERRSAATAGGLASAAFAPVASGLPAYGSSYRDSGLADNYYEYRVTAANSTGSSTSAPIQATTLRTVTLQNNMGGGTILFDALTTTGIETVQLGHHQLQTFFGSFTRWDVAATSDATVDGSGSSTNSTADACILGNATIIAN
jgi:hypothetical protein